MPKEMICPDRLLMFLADIKLTRGEDEIAYTELEDIINKFPRLNAIPADYKKGILHYIEEMSKTATDMVQTDFLHGYLLALRQFKEVAESLD